jgi:2-hydroxychromene-2-carboxylate isomerase
MAASPYRRFSSLCPTVQALVIRLIQEEFTPLLNLAAEVSEAAWARAVALADPTLLYCTAQEPVIRLCPESYQHLLDCLQHELVRAE